ncbi:succinate dehydrogenase, cytochrome b556 subunit [Arsukibacterium sp.]|jgi:succinate dehydrogenase / fumarate reductase cytochrome b subunit|uniref:succinate dehydrogenase, cytochrome b556 subunit n=1 Tax=Arsukibacterium sp. TaxID=1977258 RepID=UPI002FDB7FE0
MTTKLSLGINGQDTVKKQRPVNLDLSTISLPATAKASILHRVTGVAMFFALVFVIWAWAYSLQDEQSFEYVKGLMQSPLASFIAWGTITVLIYHLIGGIRHLIMDLGHWEELDSGNLSAKITIGLWIVLAILAGVWIWF